MLRLGSSRTIAHALVMASSRVTTNDRRSYAQGGPSNNNNNNGGGNGSHDDDDDENEVFGRIIDASVGSSQRSTRSQSGPQTTDIMDRLNLTTKPSKSARLPKHLQEVESSELWKKKKSDATATGKGGARQTAAATTLTAEFRSTATKFEDDVDDTSLTDPSTYDALSTVLTTDYELLDDAYTYFPLTTSEGGALSDGSSAPDEEGAVHARYVPGQQMIEPGYARHRIDVQFVGSDFDGWWKSTEKRRVREASAAATGAGPRDDPHEVVDTGPSIRPRAKATLEDALAIALDVSHVRVEAGALPETGCHVRRLTCHVDLPEEIELQPRTIMQRATLWLEKKRSPLAILSLTRCKNQQFHARYSGTRRVYVYRILNRIAPPLFDAGLQWHVDRYLDVDRMQRFAERLQGTMDFGYFVDPKLGNTLRKEAGNTGRRETSSYGTRSSSSSSSTADADTPPSQRNSLTVRTIDSLRVVRQDDEVLVWFAGKSFLRHQVRNIVSILKMAGQGLWTERELDQVLRRGFESSRSKAEREKPPPAPVHGLTLWELEYPPQHRDDYIPFMDSGVAQVPQELIQVW